QQFFGLHGQEVTIEHRRRLLEVLRQSDRRQLEREATRLEDTAFDLFYSLREVAVTRTDVIVGIDNADDRLADEVLFRVPELLNSRPMPERSQIVDAEPSMTAQCCRFLCHSSLPVSTLATPLFPGSPPLGFAAHRRPFRARRHLTQPPQRFRHG